MPSVSESSLSRRKTCADSFVMPYVTFRFPNRERAAAATKLNVSFQPRKPEVAPLTRGPRIQAGKLWSTTVEHEIELRLAQDEVLIREPGIQLRCTDAERIVGKREHRNHEDNNKSSTSCRSRTALLLQVRYPWRYHPLGGGKRLEGSTSLMAPAIGASSPEWLLAWR